MSAIAHKRARAICPPLGEKPFGGKSIAVAWPVARFLALILRLEVGHRSPKIETFLKNLSALAKVRSDPLFLSISLKPAGKTAVNTFGL